MAGDLAVGAIVSNEDLILEILYRLPIKSLVRFEAVCKLWRSLISHPVFPNWYFFGRLSPDSSLSGFFFQSIKESGYKFAPIMSETIDVATVPDPSLSFLGRGLQILHSCNGLLLCESQQLNSGGRVNYCVCNPITKEFVYIRKHQHPGLVKCSGLAFDPSKSLHYKVVLIECLNKGEPDARIDVYSSENGLWRSLNIVFPDFSSQRFYDRVTLWKGALHWASSFPACTSSISFDVERECFWATPLPPKPDGSRWACYDIVGSSASLNLIEDRNHMSEEFNILEMGHDYKQWHLKYHVNLAAVLQPYTKFTLLHLFNGGRETEEELWIHVPGKKFSYRIRDGACKDVCRAAPQKGRIWFTHAYSCTLSPVSPSRVSSN